MVEKKRLVGEGIGFKIRLGFDGVLIFLIAIALLVKLFGFYPIPKIVFIVLSIVGLLPVIHSAFLALLNKELTIDLLASIALIFSFLAGEWYSAAFINLMLAFARIFASWTEMRTKDTISHLLKYRPEKVKIKKGEHIIEVDIGQVKVGDLVIIETGDLVPVDGVVVSGRASLNESTLTGESLPINKKLNDKVYASTLNVSGSLLIKTEKIGAESTLERIIKLVEEASHQKSPLERIAGKFTTWYIVVILMASLGLYFYYHNFSLVLAVLLVVCADDVAVAIPLSFTSAIGRAARRGILIKGSVVVENLPKVRYFLADKTGTLTLGRPKISEIKIFNRLNRKNFLETLGAVAVCSHHPVDEAIVNYVSEHKIHIDAPGEFHETPGEGIIAIFGGKKIIVGRLEFLKNHGLVIPKKISKEMKIIEGKGYGIVAVSIDKILAGLIIFADEIRPFAKNLITVTKKLGVREWLMLTGDNEKVAKRIADEIGIDNFRANLKPEEKLKAIEEHKKEKPGILAMIGDGVNDAAALAMADISFAMGVIGSDVAIEAADVALTNDKLERIPEAMILAQGTRKIVNQCFVLWGMTNFVGLILVFAGILNPMGAAAFNFVTDFFPIFNALRVNTLKISV